MRDLFDDGEPDQPLREEITAGAVLLRSFALEKQQPLLEAIHHIALIAPFRHMMTPGGYIMSVAMTNCGKMGWVSDRRGYRYDALDPQTGQSWPQMPEIFMGLAHDGAEKAGYSDFCPNACLINRYEVGARLSLHQDKNERDFTQPIVSISLGLTATFQFGGLQRGDAVKKYALRHGDVVVWGGKSRLCYHGVLPVKRGEHPATGQQRFNLTFRRVQERK